MNVHNLASKILLDLWEYRRIVLIIGAVSIIWGLMLGRSEDDSERPTFQLGVFLIAVGIVGGFSIFSFLNADANKVIMLMQIERLWGFLTGVGVVLVMCCALALSIQLIKIKRASTAISISTTSLAPENLVKPFLRNAMVTAAGFAIVSLAWLWWLTR
jgi:hypothetical protein